MPYKFYNVLEEIGYYLAAMFSSLTLKGCIALLLLPFGWVFGDRLLFFYFWLALSVVDMIEGTILALREGAYTRARFYGWVVKFLTHSCTILVFGAVGLMLGDLTGTEIPLASWFVLVLVSTELTSVLMSAAQLGLPVPAFAMRLADLLQAGTKDKTEALFGKKTKQDEPDSKVESGKVDNDNN
jgi:phage-related holin